MSYFVAALIGAAATWPAFAQDRPALPAPPPPQGSPLPGLGQPKPPPVSAPGSAPLLAPQAAPVPGEPVRVEHVTVEGVHAYPQPEIQELAANLVGPATAPSAIAAAEQAILQHYRADGYVLTDVSYVLPGPDGTLRFIVTEGRIASVKLSGDNIGPAATQVLRFLNKLTETDGPIDATTLERYLLLAQDVPGITIHAVLQRSADPGSLNLIATITRKPISGLVTADNRAYNLTGPIEGLGVLDFNSFTEFGEKTEVSIYHTFPNSETFGQASTEFFLGASGLKLKVYGGSGNSTPTGDLATLGYLGTTTVFGAGFTYPVIRSRQQNLNLYLNLDGEESNIDTNAGTNSAAVLTSYDSLRIARLAADYTRADLLFGDNHPATNYVYGRISQGMSILGASAGENGTHPARVGAVTDFFKFNFELSRTQTLFYPWEGASVSLMGLLTGQVSPDILPPIEQFYLGGSAFTRGYYSGQVVGDNALAATAELQLNTSIDGSRVKLSPNIPAQFYLFYDWGETWQNLNQDPNIRLSSAGGGARINLTQQIEVDLEGLARSNHYPNGSGPNVSPLYGGAFYWRVLVRF